MPPTYFPLRWESTGDQWWYASPIDWAAANGHYDLVRELIRIDNNHLISLTSLRRIRRLETVWDDEAQFHNVAKCRSKVAKKLFQECEYKRGKNSLIQAGYGGWLVYTAASAGESSFIQDLLERNPLLVFGEGEYGVTDIFYAAARSKDTNVFRLIYDFAVSPRFLASQGGELVEQIGDIPPIYKWEMMNRAVHAAARGGNSVDLKELLSNCSDVLAYRDRHGSTVLHAAASRGQVEVINDLVSMFDIINSTDNLGNTALHIAAYKGQASAVESLITVSPSLISSTNIAGETFLHAAISGFITPAFRRLDRQILLMNQLMSAKVSQLDDIVSAKNNEGRTPLHLAIIANLHSELVQLLMSAPSINVNARDVDGMTPLDHLKQRPRSVSSDILIRQLISAGGIFGCHEYTARRAIASRLKMQGNGGSPGTSFRISDTEIFLHTGIQTSSDSRAEPASTKGTNLSSTKLNQLDQTDENHVSMTHGRRSSVNYAAQRLKMILHWPKVKEKIDHNSTEPFKKCNGPEVTPTPLRQRFAKSSSPSPLPNNKRALSVRSNQTSPTPKKKLASGLMNGVMQATPQANIRGRSRSNSFPKSSVSSSGSTDNQKGVAIECSIIGPARSTELTGESKLAKEGTKHKRSKSQYFCFGRSGLAVETPVIKHRRNLSANAPMISVA